MEYTKKNERSKRREGSGIKAISLEALIFFPPSVSLAQGFFTRTRKLIYRHRALTTGDVGNEKRCDVFILCKIVEVKKYYFKAR